MLPPLLNRYVTIDLKNDIIFITFKTKIEIDINAAKEILEYRIWFQQGKAYPVLCDIRKIGSMSKAARDYLTHEGLALMDRLAIVMEKGVTQFMSVLYERTGGANVPIAYFDSLQDAQAYLGERLSH